eukprot:1545100-Prymnesium_polylepis.1
MRAPQRHSSAESTLHARATHTRKRARHHRRPRRHCRPGERHTHPPARHPLAPRHLAPERGERPTRCGSNLV